MTFPVKPDRRDRCWHLNFDAIRWLAWGLMPRRAYRKARQHTLLWVVICFTGIAVEGGLLAWLSTDNWSILPWGWVLVVAVLPFAGAVIIGQVLLHRLQRQRIAQLAAVCDEFGFQLHASPSAEEKKACFAPLARLADALELKHGAERVVWIAPGSVAGNGELLLEHEYTTGSGKFIQVLTHTVVAWPVSHPSLQGTHLVNAEPFSLRYDAPLLRRARKKFARDVPGLSELSKTWRAYGNPEAATRFLLATVRAELARAPVGEHWHVGNNWVCCVYAGNLDAINLAAFLKHARLVLLSASG